MAITNDIDLENKSFSENAPEEETAEKEGKKKKKNKRGKGVETMFRITAANNMRLSKIADDKAHFLLTVNSIIISALVSLVLRNIEHQPQYIIPSIIFLFTSLITFILAILATMPIITHGLFRKQDVKTKKADLLFSGNYHNMSLKDYEWGMSEMIKDPDFLYQSMIRDNYHLGLVLDKKYKRLRLAFGFFMFGFVISVTLFLLADLIW
jgi:hypothetical protein